MSLEKLTRNQKIAVALVLFAAAALRVIYVIQYLTVTPFAHAVISDSAYYDAWAVRVLAGQGYGPSPYYMAPLYPYLLAGIYWAFGHSLPAVAWIQSALGLLNLTMIYALGRRINGHPTGLLAMILATLYAPLMFLEPKPLTETVTITLSLASLLALYHAINKPKFLTYIVAGILLGLSCLARPNMLLSTTLILGFLIVRHIISSIKHKKEHTSSNDKAAHLAALAVTIAAVIAPVTIRNVAVGNDKALITTNAGIVFAQANHQFADGIATVLPGFTTKIEDQQEQELALASKALGHPAKPSESSKYWMKQGWSWILSNPLDYLNLLGRKILWSLHPREARDVHTLDFEAQAIPLLYALPIPFPLLFGFGLFGLIAIKRKTITWISAIYVFSIMAGLVIFAVSFRYRAPAAPVLAIFAAAGIIETFKRILALDFKGLILPLACVLPVSMVSFVKYPIEAITAEAPANWGAGYLTAGQVDKSMAYSLRALELNPNLATAHYNLGLAFYRKNDLEQAIFAFSNVTRIHPHNAQARHNLATMLDEAGQTELAIQEYRQALALKPDMPKTNYNLALALYTIGKYDESYEALKRATEQGVDIDPRFEQALIKKLPSDKE